MLAMHRYRRAGHSSLKVSECKEIVIRSVADKKHLTHRILEGGAQFGRKFQSEFLHLDPVYGGLRGTGCAPRVNQIFLDLIANRCEPSGQIGQFQFKMQSAILDV